MVNEIAFTACRVTHKGRARAFYELALGLPPAWETRVCIHQHKAVAARA